MGALADVMTASLLQMIGAEGLGEEIIIDGVVCTGVWEQTGAATGNLDGYFFEQRCYQIPETELTPPVIDQQVEIDSVLWQVTAVSVAHGIVQFDVMRNIA